MSAQACSWVTNRAIQRCRRETRPSRCNQPRLAENRDRSKYTTPTTRGTNPTRPRSDRRCPPGCLLTPATGVGLRGGPSAGRRAPRLRAGSCRLVPPRAPRRRAALPGRAASRSPHAGASLPPSGQRRRRDPPRPPPRRGSWYRDGLRGERVLAQVGTSRLPGRSSGAGGGCFPATLISSHAAGVVLSDGRLGGTRRLRHRLPNARPYRQRRRPGSAGQAGTAPHRSALCPTARVGRRHRQGGRGVGLGGGRRRLGARRGEERRGRRRSGAGYLTSLFSGGKAPRLSLPSPLRPHPDSRALGAATSAVALLPGTVRCGAVRLRSAWPARAAPRSSRPAPLPPGPAARGKGGFGLRPHPRTLRPGKAVWQGNFCRGKVSDVAGGGGR